MPLHQTTKTAAALGLITIGCAPLGHGPSAVPLHPTQSHQMGGQAELAVNSPLQGAPSLAIRGAGGTMWYRHALDNDRELIFETGANVGAGIFPYGNFSLRRSLHRSETNDSGIKSLMSIALEISGGFLSVDVGLPIAMRLGQLPIWLTSHPTVGYLYWGWAYVPIGIAVQPKEAFEISATTGTFLFSQNFDLVMPSAQLGASYSW